MAKSRSGQKRRASTAKARQATAPPSPAPQASPSSLRGAAVSVAAAVGTKVSPPRPQGAPASARPSASPARALAEQLGIPTVPLVLGACAWALMAVLWAAHEVSGGFAVFLGALLTAAVAVGEIIASVARAVPLPQALQAGVVLGLAGAIPVVFDPHTADVFNLPRYTLVVIGALVLSGLVAVTAVHERRAPAWRNGLQWPLLGLVAWTVVSTFTSKDVHVSLLGNYGSYDGLYATLAFATITMVTALSIRAEYIRKVLAALAFAGGGVVVLYGLIQLHDTELGGHRWDFIAWHDTSFSNQVFSTFGNPNHMAGFFAIILPSVAVLGLTATRRWWQVAAAVFGVAILVEVLRSAARGAWVAVIASVVVLLVALAPELRRRPRLSVAGLGGLLVVVAGGMAVFGHKLLHVPLSSLFRSGGTTPVEQRFQIWHQAVLMAVHNPLTGIGPDAFALVYPQYQSAAWVKGLGPNYLVNGAHDIVMNVLADKGFVGLALFLALLAYVGLRGVGAWRRLRAIERDEASSVDEAQRAQDQRLVLAAIGAGITAYVVQALFNVQQVGLSFSFWLLVGLLGACALAAGVPDTLSPRALVSPMSAPTGGMAGPKEVPAEREAPRRPLRRRQGRRAPVWPMLLTGAAATALVVVLSLGADGPWRADHAYWAANTELDTLARASRNSPARVAAVSAAYSADMNNAMATNPWEPTYPAAVATELVATANHPSSTSVAEQDLTEARKLYTLAMADKPLAGVYAEDLAVVDVDLARTSSTTKTASLADAAKAARAALRDNPRDVAYLQLLKAIQADLRTGATNA
jgi:O-antigen ligase